MKMNFLTYCLICLSLPRGICETPAGPGALSPASGKERGPTDGKDSDHHDRANCMDENMCRIPPTYPFMESSGFTPAPAPVPDTCTNTCADTCTNICTSP